MKKIWLAEFRFLNSDFLFWLVFTKHEAPTSSQNRWSPWSKRNAPNVLLTSPLKLWLAIKKLHWPLGHRPSHACCFGFGLTNIKWNDWLKGPAILLSPLLWHVCRIYKFICKSVERSSEQGKRINKIPNIIHNMPNYKRQRQHVALLAAHCANCCCCKSLLLLLLLLVLPWYLCKFVAHHKIHTMWVFYLFPFWPAPQSTDFCSVVKCSKQRPYALYIYKTHFLANNETERPKQVPATQFNFESVEKRQQLFNLLSGT